MECKFCGSEIKLKKYVFILGPKYKYKCLKCGKEMDIHDYPELYYNIFKLRIISLFVYCFTLPFIAKIIYRIYDIGLTMSFLIGLIIIVFINSIICSHIYIYMVNNFFLDS